MHLQFYLLPWCFFVGWECILIARRIGLGTSKIFPWFSVLFFVFSVVEKHFGKHMSTMLVKGRQLFKFTLLTGLAFPYICSTHRI